MNFNIYSFVCLISIVLCGGTFIGYCMEQLVLVKEDAPSAGGRLFCWTLFPLLSTSVKVAMMNAQNMAAVVAIANIFYICSAIVMVWKYYAGKVLDKYRVYAALIFATVAGDMTFGMLYLLLTGQALKISSYNTASAAIACTGTALIGSFYMVLIVQLGNRRKQKGKLYVPVLMVLLAVFVCAGAAASGAAASGDTQELTYDAAFIFACACISFALYLCLCILFVLEQIRSTKREREEFLRALEIEQMRCRALEERREELAKLRHDYRNILTTVTILLENGDTEKARELLSDASVRAQAADRV